MDVDVKLVCEAVNGISLCMMQGQQLHLYFLHTLFHDSGLSAVTVTGFDELV